jgi:hypothetical protein
VVTQVGSGGQSVEIHWPEPVYGDVHITVACDLPS